MPLRVTAAINKKIGLPNYSSLGASCGVEFELDSMLLREDPTQLLHQVRAAHAACAKAVNDELRRQRDGDHCRRQEAGHAERPGANGRGVAGRPPTTRPPSNGNGVNNTGVNNTGANNSDANNRDFSNRDANNRDFSNSDANNRDFSNGDANNRDFSNGNGSRDHHVSDEANGQSALDATPRAITPDDISDHTPDDTPDNGRMGSAAGNASPAEASAMQADPPSPDTAAAMDSAETPLSRRATDRQLAFLRQLASQVRGLGFRRLERLVIERFDVPLCELSGEDASRLIDQLKSVRAGECSLGDVSGEVSV